MVLYECKSCNYSTELKSNYVRHIKSKKHGRNTDPNYDVLKEIALKSQKEPKKSQNEPEKSQNEPEMSQRFFCDYCNKEFSTKANKRKHELHRCTEIPAKLQHKHDKAEWKKEKKQLYKQIDALIKKAGNTTTNNLNLNSYGKEDLSHITDNFKTGLLKGPYGMIPKMKRRFIFSDDKPKNKNISLTNKKTIELRYLRMGNGILQKILHS